MLVRMKIEGLLFDPRSNMYILLLKEDEGNGTLPIWIGKPEADAIALSLGKVATPRPLTHDLVKNVMNAMDIKVSRIVITQIMDNTYYALIYMTDGKREIPIDARPSDAVAIALRSDAPVFVQDDVMGTKNPEEMDEWLKDLKPEDFGTAS